MSKLQAPFPYFGGKSLAAKLVWNLLGDPPNYVEPFAGSLAMVLARDKPGKIETVNDKDAFVANFWRAIASDPEDVAYHADWPVNECDLFARHSWLMSQADVLRFKLESDHLFYDSKIAGYWVWGACAWIGSGWCSGKGPWIRGDGDVITRRGKQIADNGECGINRQLPHLGDAGQGINRKLPHLGNAGRGINRQLPHLGNAGRGDFISDWFARICERLRDVRVCCGDWRRVLTNTPTIKHGVTGIFLDPPYTLGNVDYAAGGVGGAISSDVNSWCVEHGDNKQMKIVLCGHDGEHDNLLLHGWTKHNWKARRGMAATVDSVERRKSETIWASPYCEKIK